MTDHPTPDTNTDRDRAAATVFTGITRLVSHDPAHGDGDAPPTMPGLGAGLDHAWLVVEDGRVAASGTGPPPDADEQVDVDGGCVLPGFVDSHTHLVFAGDRSSEFAARMAGADYEAGGIATTMAATAAADDAELRDLLATRVAESRAAGTTTREIKSGYADTVAGEARLLALAGEVTEHVTFLGAHVTPPTFPGDGDAWIDLVTGRMLDHCADLATSIDVFCERGAFDRDQAAAVLQAGLEAGLVPRVHANQLGEGPGVQLAVEVGAASADHCTHLSDDDVAALAGSDTVATLLPATDFSTRQPYPDGRRLVDAGATVALATNCNPGSSFTTSMAFVLALAVRDCHLTVDEAVWAATMGGARSLDRDDVGHLSTGARADLAILSAPGPNHLVYRPGMPMVASTWEAGRHVAGGSRSPTG